MRYAHNRLRTKPRDSVRDNAHAGSRDSSRTAPHTTLRTGSHASPRRPVVAYALLALAVLLIVGGILQGDALDTLRKAALICFECIGIG